MTNNIDSYTDVADDSLRASRVSLDYRRVVARVVQWWYLIVASILAGLTIAYLVNRYTTRIYPVTTSIIIREPAENTDARFLYNNPLVNAYRNYFNEPYIIRSYPLVQKVVEELMFQVSIEKEGNLKSSEQYSVPFRLELLGRTFGTLNIKFISATKFQCSANEDDFGEHALGDTVVCDDVKFMLLEKGDVSSLIGDQYVIQIQDPQEVAGNYINKLTVEWAEPGSSVVNLSIRGPIPQKEIDFLSALISNYQQYDLEKKSQAASRSLIFITEQLIEIGDSLHLYENALEQFKQKNFVTDLSAEAQQLYEQLKELGAQNNQVKFAGNYYDYLDRYLKKEDNYSQLIFPSSIGLQDPILNALVTQLVSLQTELNLLPLARESNPLVAEKSKKLKDGILQIRRQLIAALINLRNTDKIKSKGIQQQIDRIGAQLRTLPLTERRLVNIQRNYTFSESMYNFLQQKKAEAGISKASTTSDVIVVNPPRLAGGAITPKVRLNFLIYGLAGLIIPIILFTFVELLNNKVLSREDVEKLTSIPFLGGIGHKDLSTNLVVVDSPKSAIAESFRGLRSNLNYFTENKDKKVFMITSSIAGEGKTFTSINLATVLAMSGKRTLIIGADLRKPKIFADFGLKNDIGLSTYLSGMSSMKEIIQHTNVENLDLITGGPVPPNPGELLLSKRMDSLMSELLNGYEYILLDTPPLALITDGLVLARFADHIIYITRQNYTPRELIRVADEMYSSGKLRNMSFVLNDIRMVGPGYGYGYAYGYGYGYGYRSYGHGTDADEYYSDRRPS